MKALPSIDDLLSDAALLYPGSRLSLSMVLVGWGLGMQAKALAACLERIDFATSRFVSALTPLTKEPDPRDRRALDEFLGEVSPEGKSGWHLLKKLCDTPDQPTAVALTAAGLNLEHLKKVLLETPAHEVAVGDDDFLARWAEPTPALERYGRGNLTKLALAGAFDSLEERPDELRRVEDVLMKRQSANVVLTGDAGVGKTSIAESLARRIARKQVPRPLLNSPVFELNMGSVVAGTKYRGEFEARIEAILGCAKKLKLEGKPPILFCDELHLLWGAGRAEGAPMDGANLLKPALANGEIRVIGATTTEEFHQYICRDAALARRFEEVLVPEPDGKLLHAMVARQARALERHHGLVIADAIIDETIRLTELYVPARRQPDKSVAALDSACLLGLRNSQAALEPEDLTAAVSRMAGVDIAPAGKSPILRSLRQRLAARIIGQDHAIQRIAGVLACRLQALGQPSRPRGVFLFGGPTGVGKTELARVLAAECFGSDRSLLLVDMGEYGSAMGIEKLIGAAPGYVSSDREGILGQWVHQNAAGVICFDEIEKCHPDLWSLLLGITDNGRVRSGKGALLDLRQHIIVATTNSLKAEDLKPAAIGFSGAVTPPDVLELLAKFFPREFLARFDELILFNPLGLEDLRRILRLRLREASQRFQDRACPLEYDEQRLVEFLLPKLTQTKTGAREIARLLEKEVLQPISLALLTFAGGVPGHIVLDDDFYRTREVKCVATSGEAPPTSGRHSLLAEASRPCAGGQTKRGEDAELCVENPGA